MATIRETSTGRTKLLEPEHLVGRASRCSLHINERYVSAQHAIFRWSGRGWELKDLGSRNGTFLNGMRLQPAEEHPVRPGSQVSFGKPEQLWEVVDDSEPRTMVVPLDGGDPLVFD